MRARDVHELVELKQVENMVLIAELMLKASLMRTESRGSHYREDYPRLDNENWMKWIVVSQENGDINLRTEPLPLDKYRFKPTRYYSDNFQDTGRIIGGFGLVIQTISSCICRITDRKLTRQILL